MSLSCECDFGDSPELYFSKIVKARKEHKCHECRRTIKRREEYRRIKLLWEGTFEITKMCEKCDDLAASLAALGFCWDVGDLHGAHKEYIREYAPPKLNASKKTQQELTP